MKTVVIDNYDSFTYNLVHYIEDILGEKPTVLRNDQFDLADLEFYDVIILSPGPGLPNEANLLPEVVATYAHSKIILGVCLGHQCIAQFYGANLSNLNRVHHGVASKITIIKPDEIHKNFSTLEVGRYHSWVVSDIDFPDELLVTSRDSVGHIMSFKHKNLPLFGIQYHPESVLTPNGKELLTNFFEYCRSNSQSFNYL